MLIGNDASQRTGSPVAGSLGDVEVEMRRTSAQKAHTQAEGTDEGRRDEVWVLPSFVSGQFAATPVFWMTTVVTTTTATVYDFKGCAGCLAYIISILKFCLFVFLVREILSLSHACGNLGQRG